MCLIDLNQTKRIHHRPWCGHAAYVLGWGVIMPQAMIRAKATERHGSGVKQETICRKLIFQDWYNST